MLTYRPFNRWSFPRVGVTIALGLMGCAEADDHRTRTAVGTTVQAVVAESSGTQDSARLPPPPADTPLAVSASTNGASARSSAPAMEPATRPSPPLGPRAAPPTLPPSQPVGRAPVDTAPRRDSSAAATASRLRADQPTPAGPPPVPRRAFPIGERLTYDVRFGPIRVGQASMEVIGIEPFRGRDAYHTRFLLRGGTAFFRVNDRYESWFDARTLESLRYAQQIDQGSYERERVFDIFPERRTFVEAGKDPQPSVADPLDDGSFFYFLRTIPLEVGKTYEFNRYFRPDRNPVRVTVLRRELIRVPAGTFDAIVVRPTIKTTGIFSEGGRAEVWFADDSTRRMLQMRSRLSFGSLSLELRRVE